MAKQKKRSQKALEGSVFSEPRGPEQLETDENADDFARLSAALGSNPLLIQGPGGNVSIKDGDTLWIKASGFWLSDALRRDIFVPVSIREVLEAADKGLESFPSRGGLRPSVETPLHALLPQRVVLHLHMLDAVIHAGLPEARERLDSLLAGLSWRLLPYARPGLPLCRLVRESIKNDGPSPVVLVLKNHGVVIAAEDEGGAISLANDLTRRLWLASRPLLVPDIPDLSFCNDLDWRIPLSPLPHALAFGAAAAALRRGGPLCPEQVVFLGATICAAEPGARLSAIVPAFLEAGGHAPSFVVIPQRGVLFPPDIGACAESLVEALAHVALRMPENGLLEGLSRGDLAELTAWDAEKRRGSRDRPRIVRKRAKDF
jgi:rhamnose utilization protein RhaD (predicted bifunctional aldolase and dehydrogenase)